MSTTSASSQPSRASENLLIIAWFGAGISSILVLLRLFYASRKGKSIRWDFIWAVLALAAALLATAFITKAAHYGLGKNLAEIGNLTSVLKLTYWIVYAAVTGVMSASLSKFAIIALLLDTIGSGPDKRWSRVVLWTLAVVIFVVNTVSILVSLFQCSPTRKLWNWTVAGSCPRRNVATILSYINASVAAVSDLIFFAWPTIIVWGMNMRRSDKIAFGLFMSIVALACIPSWMRIVLTKRLEHNPDSHKIIVTLWLWTVMGMYALIILPSILTLRPLWTRLFHKAKTSVTGASASEGSSAFLGGPLSRNSELASRRSRQPGDDNDDDDLGRHPAFVRNPAPAVLTGEERDAEKAFGGETKHVVVQKVELN